MLGYQKARHTAAASMAVLRHWVQHEPLLLRTDWAPRHLLGSVLPREHLRRETRNLLKIEGANDK